MKKVQPQGKQTITVRKESINMSAMNMKSSRGQSSINAPKMGMKNSAPKQIVSGKKIVMKPINTHRTNPGFKKGM